MAWAERAESELDVALKQLSDEHLVVLELDRIVDLVVEPDTDPLRPRRSPYQPGVDDLAATLVAARDLPDELTVRVLLPEGAATDVDVAEAQHALHQRARYSATVSWREATAVRNMGHRQLPVGIVLSIAAAALAYGFSYLASEAGSGFVFALLIVLAFVSITVAWVVSWMVIETAYVDWRPPSRLAAAYELLSHATLEVVEDKAPPG